MITITEVATLDADLVAELEESNALVEVTVAEAEGPSPRGASYHPGFTVFAGLRAISARADFKPSALKPFRVAWQGKEYEIAWEA